MKKILVLVVLFRISILYVSGQIPHVNSGAEFVYIGFYAIPNSGFCNQLLFRIHNNTNDTLYIPVKDIKVKVSKDGKMLKEDSLRVHNFHPISLNDEFIFFSRMGNPLESIEVIMKRKRVVDNLKRNYSRKLYRRNFGNTAMTKEFLLAVSTECIVLLPKEKVNYSEYFFSRNLNQTYEIEAFYTKSNVFTIYDDDKGNQVEVKY